MSESPPVQFFAGAIVWTERLEAMVAFYEQTLRLPVHSRHPDFVAFEVGGIRLSVGQHSQVHGPAVGPTRVMINLGVRDIQASAAMLRSAGVEFVRPPEREHWGGWVATFRDPDGNLLQLLQTA